MCPGLVLKKLCTPKDGLWENYTCGRRQTLQEPAAVQALETFLLHNPRRGAEGNCWPLGSAGRGGSEDQALERLERLQELEGPCYKPPKEDSRQSCQPLGAASPRCWRNWALEKYPDVLQGPAR